MKRLLIFGPLLFLAAALAVAFPASASVILDNGPAVTAPSDLFAPKDVDFAVIVAELPCLAAVEPDGRLSRIDAKIEATYDTCTIDAGRDPVASTRPRELIPK